MKTSKKVAILSIVFGSIATVLFILSLFGYASLGLHGLVCLCIQWVCIFFYVKLDIAERKSSFLNIP